MLVHPYFVRECVCLALVVISVCVLLLSMRAKKKTRIIALLIVAVVCADAACAIEIFTHTKATTPMVVTILLLLTSWLIVFFVEMHKIEKPVRMSIAAIVSCTLCIGIMASVFIATSKIERITDYEKGIQYSVIIDPISKEPLGLVLAEDINTTKPYYC